jgi:hypothetical protein
MSEKVTKRLRSSVAMLLSPRGGRLNRRGHQEVRRRRRALPWNERKNFDVGACLLAMEKEQVVRGVKATNEMARRVESVKAFQEAQRRRRGLLGWRSAMAGMLAGIGAQRAARRFR